MELSKADKKAAREIIEKGLQQEFADGLNKAYSILGNWKTNRKNNRETYHALYAHIRDFDKQIARRYDNMTGSKYLFIIAGQIIDEAVDESDLINLSPEACNFINRIVSLDKL
jgi:hypothetical protein